MSRDALQNGRAQSQSHSGSQSQSQSQQENEHDREQLGCLARLPEKLLLMIFDILGHNSRRDLCNMSLANKKYHALADRVLYKSILFESPEHHLTFSESLHRRPRRGSLIQDVKLEYPSYELSHLILDSALEQSNTSHYSRKGIDGLSRTLSAMSNLETLDIAVPVKLLHGIGALFNGPFDLACLKSCTLLFQSPDNAYWDLRENIHIFTHPTLETLIIKRAKLDEKGFDFMERPHSTALKTLRLIECDINDDSLADILEFPEGLKEFYMYHTADPQPELEESSNEINEHVMALKDQAQTLESITIDHPTLGGRKVLRLRDFQSCKTLRLSLDTQLFGKTGKKPRMHSAGLPPQLETLEFFEPLGSDEMVTELFSMMIENMDFMARRLKTLIVAEGPNGVPEQILEACKGKNFELQIRRHGENGLRRPEHLDGAKTKANRSEQTGRPTGRTKDSEVVPVKDRVRWNALSEEAWGKSVERKPFDPF
ncbi:hypothetical protein VPNG_04978 [Cytospora leucostoma]|uniref:F-box domain-containing protein n=1 Tax=Cytospora leucostoma TaxID=1230097 RepID=A0A423X7Q3_9PEZI|nr:hypothetical protein VPNG_04978 [Cytospora leucostoma]